MGQHYHHLKPSDRNLIQIRLNAGCTQTAIATELGRPRSCISREIRRNSITGALPGTGYDAGTASKASLDRRRRGLVRLAEGTPLRALVLKYLRLAWSPQQISGRLKQMDEPQTVSHETIYKAVHILPRGDLRKELIDMLRQGKKLRHPRTKGADRRGSLPGMVSIHERPAEVLTRELPGDWEGDLIKGAGNASCVGTLAERKTRFVILAKMKDASADAALAGFSRGLGRVPQALRTSLAYDQGKEMARHQELAKRLNIKVYFCDPHSPWQRPLNENTNGLVRQFLAKGTDLSIYSQKDLDIIADSLNNRPRQTLGFRTPLEAWQEEISKIPVAVHS